MIPTIKKIFLSICFISIIQVSFSQNEIEVNTVGTAVPFLRITPDARSGAMGDVGIGLSADANAQFYNAAKIPFADKDLGLSLSYSPWLRSLGISDIFLAHLAAYYKIGDIQSVSLSLKYFNLGNILFTDAQGQEIRNYKPREFAFDVAYARRLGKRFSMGVGFRYINSNLASGEVLNTGEVINAANAFAADISFFYQKDLEIGKKDLKGVVRFGTTLSNIGSKVSYSNDAINQDFLPANLGLGTGFDIYPNDLHKVGIYFDMNKLMVPTPRNVDLDNDGSVDAEFDQNNNTVADYREDSPIAGMFKSFGDAPGGFKEELREINLSMGAEYAYNELFFLRLGYFWEHATKGNRKYFTAGLGVKYNVFGLDFSYLVPTSNERNPLDNTLRFTLKFDFEDIGGKRNKEDELLLEE